MHIDSTSDPADNRWLTLRTEFVPEISVEVQREFLRNFIRESRAVRAFLATDPEAGLLGFAEVAVRTDYVNGCHYRPALFLEGIFVRPEHRGRGVARALCDAAGEWGVRQGCREFAGSAPCDRLHAVLVLSDRTSRTFTPLVSLSRVPGEGGARATCRPV